jgi:hypothetical protein
VVTVTDMSARGKAGQLECRVEAAFDTLQARWLSPSALFASPRHVPWEIHNSLARADGFGRRPLRGRGGGLRGEQLSEQRQHKAGYTRQRNELISFVNASYRERNRTGVMGDDCLG